MTVIIHGIAADKFTVQTIEHFATTEENSFYDTLYIRPLSVINNFGEDPTTSHNFAWQTPATETKGGIEYCEKVRFEGFDKDNIIRVQAKYKITKTDLDNRVIHKVELNNLKPGTEYVYRIGTQEFGFSEQGTFCTAENEVSAFTFINITDIQGETINDYEAWKNTLDKSLQNFPEAKFVLLTGDFVDDGYNIIQWDQFSSVVSKELMNIPIIPILGNHDALNDNGTNPDAKNFTEKFNLTYENTVKGAMPGTVYSFDYGNAHIAVMNTECETKDLKNQAEWLRGDMADSNKLWKIIALHKGPYGSAHAKDASVKNIREAWIPIFDELNIDLVLQGHDHNYIRSYPMKDGNRVSDGKGTIYITSNTGGVKFYPKESYQWQAVDLQPNKQMYTGIIINGSIMTIDAYEIDGHLIDSYVIKK